MAEVANDDPYSVKALNAAVQRTACGRPLCCPTGRLNVKAPGTDTPESAASCVCRR